MKTNLDWETFNHYYNVDTKIQDNYINATAMQMSAQRKQKQELELQQLFEFLEKWKEKYDIFCHVFDCYSYYVTQDMIWDRKYDINSFDCLGTTKKEVHIDGFFNTILNRYASFELRSRSGYYSKDYGHSLQNDIMVTETDKFRLSGKDGNYHLNTRFSVSLVVSLIAALSDNCIVFDLMKNKKFSDFMGNLCYTATIDFSLRNNAIDIPDKIIIDCPKFNSEGLIRFSINSEVLIIKSLYGTNKLTYPHLDKIFGTNRTKPLDSEDLQLYSILNSGNKPLMYDFEF